MLYLVLDDTAPAPRENPMHPVSLGEHRPKSQRESGGQQVDSRLKRYKESSRNIMVGVSAGATPFQPEDLMLTVHTVG